MHKEDLISFRFFCPWEYGMISMILPAASSQYQFTYMYIEKQAVRDVNSLQWGYVKQCCVVKSEFDIFPSALLYKIFEMEQACFVLQFCLFDNLQ